MKNIVPLIADIVDNNDKEKEELRRVISHQSKKIERLELLFMSVNESINPKDGFIYCDGCDMPEYGDWRIWDEHSSLLKCCNGCEYYLCAKCKRYRAEWLGMSMYCLVTCRTLKCKKCDKSLLV